MDADGSIRCILSGITSLSMADTPSAPSGLLGLVLLFIVLVVAGGYFGGSESAFSAMNRIRIKSKADDGNKRAKNALYISNNFDRALTTLLIGNNITHIAAASVATLIATRLFGTSAQVTVLCTLVSTLIVFFFSEMIPKAFANDRSETMSLLCAGSLRVLMKILTPLTAFFTAISGGTTKLIRRFIKQTEEPTITEEELYEIIDTIEEEGVLNSEQGDLIKSALDFSGTRAQDIMTMRGDIRAIDAALSNEAILQIVRETNHTRLPIYEGDLDHIIGTLHIRVFIREYLKDPAVNIRSLMLPAFRVSPDAMIDDLLTEMRQHKLSLAVVTDASGKTVGLVTIEDFLEELVGEIWDEDDVVDHNFVKLGGNRFRVNPRLTMKELCQRIGIPLPDPAVGARPLLSLMLERFGKIPEEDESYRYHNIEITVETVENAKVTSVLLRLLSEEELAAEADAQPDAAPDAI